MLYVFASGLSHDFSSGISVEFSMDFPGSDFFFRQQKMRHEFFRGISEECQDASSMSGPMPKELEAEALTRDR